MEPPAEAHSRRPYVVARLALQYRPRTFNDVIEQAQVTDVLKAIVAKAISGVELYLICDNAGDDITYVAIDDR